MANATNFIENKLVDQIFRAQAYTFPATLYVALITCSKGIVARSTAYSLNDTAVVSATDGKYHLYKVTTAGTTAASAPTYAGALGEVITDGTAVLTEQDAGLDAGTAQVEVSGGAYARVSVAGSLANWAGTQGAGSTTASTGTSGQTSNNGAVTFPTPTAGWATGTTQIWGWTIYDAATAGNPLIWGPLSAPKTVNNGDPAPSFAIGALTVTID